MKLNFPIDEMFFYLYSRIRGVRDMATSSKQAVPFLDLRMCVATPSHCINSKPSSHSIRLGGEYISLSQLARSSGVECSYVSRILSGQRVPTRPTAHKLATALGMRLDDFHRAIEARKEILSRKRPVKRKERKAHIKRMEKWLQRRGLI